MSVMWQTVDRSNILTYVKVWDGRKLYIIKTGFVLMFRFFGGQISYLVKIINKNENISFKV